MKHTTTRKKMLLSSVAMLLVAMMALGSATFAWYVSNPTATASGLTLETSTGTGLLARSQTEMAFYTAKAAAATDENPFTVPEWGHDTKLDVKAYSDTNNGSPVADTDPTSLQPVSGGKDGFATTNFFKVAASEDGKFDADTTKDIENAAAADYYSEKVFLKLSDSTATGTQDVYLNRVSMTKAAENVKNIYKAIRVAVYGTDNALKGTYGLDTEGNLYLTGTGAYADNKSGTAYAYKEVNSEKTVWTTTTAGVVNVGKVGSGDTTGVTVVVYLDGEDSECYSRNVINAQDLVKDVHLSFTLTAPTT